VPPTYRALLCGGKKQALCAGLIKSKQNADVERAANASVANALPEIYLTELEEAGAARVYGTRVLRRSEFSTAGRPIG
jgi:hypothetical protein